VGAGGLQRPAKNILTRRANQRHYCIITQFANAHGRADNGIFGAIAIRRADRSRRPNPPFFTGKTAERMQQQGMDCFIASAFARRRASADKSASRNDGKTQLRDLAACFPRFNRAVGSSQ
jgi:hypothetical protein